MRIDRDAAAIVADRQETVGTEFHFDEGGMAGQRLVHRVVDDLGEQMMQRLLVGAADIHAWTAAHRLEAFQHLDVARGVAGFRAGRAGSHLERRPGFGLRAAKQVVRLWLSQLISMVLACFFMCCMRFQ